MECVVGVGCSLASFRVICPPEAEDEDFDEGVYSYGLDLLIPWDMADEDECFVYVPLTAIDGVGWKWVDGDHISLTAVQEATKKFIDINPKFANMVDVFIGVSRL